MLFLLSGLLLFRLPTVQLFALLFQLPPRLTRLEPDAAPYKVHTVFNQKIFEPLKRLTQCRSFLFSKISCTASTHLCFGRCAVTGGLRCALHCLPAYAQMCVNSRAPSQAEAKIAVPDARTVAAPKAYRAAVRVGVPAAAAIDAVTA